MIEQALVAILAADGGVSALVGTRIYPNKFPAAPTYPAITYTAIADTTEVTHDGKAGPSERRMQFDLYAETYAGVAALKRAVKSALTGFAGNAGNPVVHVQGIFPVTERDLDEQATEQSAPRVYRKSLDFYVWFQEE